MKVVQACPSWISLSAQTKQKNLPKCKGCPDIPWKTDFLMEKLKNNHSKQRCFLLSAFPLAFHTNPWPPRNTWPVITFNDMTTCSLTLPGETELGTTYPAKHPTLELKSYHWWLPEDGT